ncbi:MAG: thiamine pyrophosphate-binding protein, partial [Deltaproteobacteria bacterium]|nr:thiamine pyrophosphate-binding protein [Deltaproteobacteria bacterium]
LFDESFYAKDSPLPQGCVLIQLDNSSWEIGKNIPAAVGLLADPKPGLQELLAAVTSSMDEPARKSAAERRAAMTAQKQQELKRQEKRARDKWGNMPISPPRFMAELRDCLPGDAVIYNETITASADLMRTLLPEKPGSYFGNHGGGIGQGLPGALGVKLACPERPVVALIGDGSAMYTVQSFWTAAHHHIPVLYIILNNQTYRILKYNLNRYRQARRQEPRPNYPFMDLTDPPLDFVEIARGMGIEGKSVTRPEDVKPAVKEALSLDKPYVLEVRTEGRLSAR